MQYKPDTNSGFCHVVYNIAIAWYDRLFRIAAHPVILIYDGIQNINHTSATGLHR
jgi:hypothetical protein